MISNTTIAVAGCIETMINRRSFVASTVGILLILLAFNAFAYADELKGSIGSLNALNSGYAITRWPWDGGDVPLYHEATVRACTTHPPHPEATKVVFRWIRPDDSHWDVGPIALVESGDTWDGKPIWDAYDTQTLDMVGSWGVQALFLDGLGKLQGPNPYAIVQIKAISWHVIPEVPLGTVVSLLGMFGSLCVFAIVKRKKLL